MERSEEGGEEEQVMLYSLRQGHEAAAGAESQGEAKNIVNRLHLAAEAAATAKDDVTETEPKERGCWGIFKRILILKRTCMVLYLTTLTLVLSCLGYLMHLFEKVDFTKLREIMDKFTNRNVEGNNIFVNLTSDG